MIGNVVTFPLCGVLVDSYGWPSAFYVIGSITLVWLVFWRVFNSPISDLDLRFSIFI